ncbi:MAG: hypothetical protein ABIK99_05575 [candidate division WOR-3 bacterium]
MEGIIEVLRKGLILDLIKGLMENIEDGLIKEIIRGLIKSLNDGLIEVIILSPIRVLIRSESGSLIEKAFRRKSSAGEC